MVFTAQPASAGYMLGLESWWKRLCSLPHPPATCWAWNRGGRGCVHCPASLRRLHVGPGIVVEEAVFRQMLLQQPRDVLLAKLEKRVEVPATLLAVHLHTHLHDRGANRILYCYHIRALSGVT